jgi:hypothetical protein
MAYDVDPACEKSHCRTIKLSGREFYVAPLPLRHVLATAELMPKLSNISPQNIRSETLDAVIDLVHKGLHKAHPGLTRDELLDLPVTIAELMDAVPIVIEQAGGRKVDAAAGESRATSG